MPNDYRAMLTRLEDIIDSAVEEFETPGRAVWNAAQMFAGFVRRAIIEQRYANEWKPWSEKYEKWREKIGRPGDKMWILSGALLTNITAFPIGNNSFMVGIPDGVMGDPSVRWGRGAYEIAAYAAIQETARPLFKLAARDFREIDMMRGLQGGLQRLKKKWK